MTNHHKARSLGRLELVLAAGNVSASSAWSTSTLWFDANGDGRFAETERHTLTDKLGAIEAKITVPLATG